MGRVPRPRCRHGWGIGQSEQNGEMGAVCHRHVTDSLHRRVVVPVQLGDYETVSVCNVFCPRLSIGLSNSWKDKKLRQALVGPCELATQDVAGPLQSWRLYVSTWASISSGRPPLLLEAFLWRQGFLLKPSGFVSTNQFASWFLFNGRF